MDKPLVARQKSAAGEIKPLMRASLFDAGVRLGERLARDMIRMRIGPDFRPSPCWSMRCGTEGETETSVIRINLPLPFD